MLKRIKRYLVFSLISLGAIIGIYLLLSVVLSMVTVSPQHSDCHKTNEVYVASNGVHLDLILPRKHLSAKLIRDLVVPTSVSFVTFGWGDREFYLKTPTWSDFSLVTGLKATFLRQETVIHISLLTNQYPHWQIIPICNHQTRLLNDYLMNWFKYSGSSNLVEIKASGYPVTDQFYLANGNYNYINTCNNWVNNALKTALIKTSIWSPFDWGVLYHARKNNRG